MNKNSWKLTILIKNYIQSLATYKKIMENYHKNTETNLETVKCTHKICMLSSKEHIY